MSFRFGAPSGRAPTRCATVESRAGSISATNVASASICSGVAPEARAWELYDLAGDPAETRNVHAPDHPEVARLRPLLQEWLSRQPAEEAGGLDVSEGDEAALRFLGYIE